ncbi:peptidylprolyl isomerase [Borrelia coriaceae]|uniref:Basic membrane protein n=1 Tax=Borrelia coriaceae ATCC 43381 TaxID=1408429 RepID=W5SU96_9SPIR|nr:peptidylprolyl isomerase [Borrelia coriaceae]AHH10263.1 Basic membrane protein [Borrelia coriaceae ATCC 43381]UPA15985.1 peptidylprolyl isomerase [Borrelia coriaceae]
MGNFLCFLLFFCIGMTSFAQNTPVVIINLHSNEIITKTEFDSKVNTLKKTQGRDLSNVEKKQVLQVLIADVLFGQEALKQGIKVEDEEVMQTIKAQFGLSNLTNEQIKQMIESQGTNWNELLSSMKRSISAQKLILKIAQPKFSEIKVPSEKEVIEYYEANKTKFVNPDMARISHVFFSSKDKKRSEVLAKSKDIANQIKSKKITFEEAVRKYSNDEASKVKNGDLGFLARGDQNAQSVLGVDFIKEVFMLNKGDISQPILSKEGFHIVKVTEMYSQRFLDLQDKISPNVDMTVKDAIKNNMVNIHQQQIVARVQQELYDKLNKSASIQILDSSLK